VQVFHGEDQGLLPTAGEEELPNGFEGPRLARFGTELCKLVVIGLQAQQVEEQGQAGVGVEARSLEAGTRLGNERFWTIIRGDPTVVPQQIQYGQIGRHAPVRQALPFRIPNVLPDEALANLIEEPGFPHARRSHQTHGLSSARLGLIEDGIQ
jgi:hypothetical protein